MTCILISVGDIYFRYLLRNVNGVNWSAHLWTRKGGGGAYTQRHGGVQKSVCSSEPLRECLGLALTLFVAPKKVVEGRVK